MELLSANNRTNITTIVNKMTRSRPFKTKKVGNGRENHIGAFFDDIRSIILQKNRCKIKSQDVRGGVLG